MNVGKRSPDDPLEMGQDMQDYADVEVKPPILFLGAILLGCLLSWIVPLGPGLGSANALALSVGGALAAVGLALFVVSVREFRRAGTSVVPGEASTVLLDRGPYRYTRNPIYISFIPALGDPIRDERLFSGVFVVVVVSLVIQGWTIGPVARLLGFGRTE